MQDIFGPSTLSMRGLYVSLNYPHAKFKKMLCPKNPWIGVLFKD